MRFFTVATAVLAAGLSLSATAQVFTDPGAYNNAIVAEQRAMLKKTCVTSANQPTPTTRRRSTPSAST
ncbi:hypothetical protein [Hymenobacter sp.]|jgi:hypothetical protein|uniref:hypothetical protein n=1 Tax=Hymenobacter sp. TaxID=1898978 RepID=UPI002ED7EA16